jgi:hypothetical protein
MHPLRLAFVLFTFAYLVSCSSESADEPAGEFLVVRRVAPSSGTDQAPTEARIGFEVDASIDPSSLTAETFYVTGEDGERLSGMRVVLEDDSTAAELILDEPMDVITTYRATITTGLRSRSGDTLEEDFEWTFKTLDSEWGISEWIEEDINGTSSEPEIAIDAQSNAIAVWEHAIVNQQRSAIWANRYNRTDLWSEPVAIDSGTGDASDPALAVDDAGNAIAVWVRRDGQPGNTRIWSNRYDAALGAWDTAELLQSGEILRANAPDVAAAPNGIALAVWVQDEMDTVDRAIWSRTYTAGSGWGDAGSISEVDAAAVLANNLSVGMDDEGNGLAVWTRATLDGDVVWANRFTAGSGWGTPELIKPDESTSARGVRLSVGAAGDAFVVWSQGDGTREDVWAARWSGTAWEAPERVDQYDDGEKRTPDIAVDGAGIAHAVWAQVEDPFINIWASQYTPGSGWEDPILIEPPNEDPNEDGDATLPRAGINTAGNAFVVWLQTDENWSSVWSNRLDPETGWFEAEVIEDIDRPARPPVIAVGEDRRAHALWPHFVSDGFDWCRTNRFE